MENLLFFRNVHMYTFISRRFDDAGGFGGEEKRNDDVVEVYRRSVALAAKFKSRHNQLKLCPITKIRKWIKSVDEQVRAHCEGDGGWRDAAGVN